MVPQSTTIHDSAQSEVSAHTNDVVGAPEGGSIAGRKPPPAVRPVLIASAAGGAVALSLGIYGRVHSATGQQVSDFGLGSMLAMKVWLATAAAGLAMMQLGSASWMYGRVPPSRPAPRHLALFHRWLGTAAFVLTLPVAYHCLWSLGFQPTTGRVLVHSLFGCAFYGAFVSKMLLLRAKHVPDRAIPVVGGLLVALLTGAWFTSALWVFNTIGVPN